VIIEVIPAATPEEITQAELEAAWNDLQDNTLSYVEQQALRFVNTPVMQILAEEAARAKG
jgi:hypothetical protein